MPFQIKDFVSIVAAQVNHARSITDKVTDFQPGSVVRTIMEAPAVEMEELYLQMFLGLRDAIPVATFLSFGFETLEPARAHGFVSVSREADGIEDIVIPVGTVFTALDGRLYRASQAVVWAAASRILRVPVEYALAGQEGNIAQGVITASDLFQDGYLISNGAIDSGRDRETGAEREIRFAEFVASLSRGTVVACLYAARQSRVLDADGNTYEYVTRAGIDEQPGWVRIYVYSNRGIASTALLADGQLRMDGSRDDSAGTITPGFRAAGVRVDVLAMQERQVPLSIRVRMLPGFTLTAGIQQLLGDVFGSEVRAVPPGGVLYLGTLVQAMLAVTGVQEIVPTTSENIVCAVGEALVPGALSVTLL